MFWCGASTITTVNPRTQTVGRMARGLCFENGVFRPLTINEAHFLISNNWMFQMKRYSRLNYCIIHTTSAGKFTLNT